VQWATKKKERKTKLTSETTTNEIVVANSNIPQIPDTPESQNQIIERVDYLIDRIHKCEQDKLIYLLEIHQNQYWKMESPSFEHFCKQRLGYSKQYVYRCINAAKMLEAGIPVENPNQSLALEGLDIEEAKVVWDRAKEKADENGGDINAAVLKAARREQGIIDRAEQAKEDGDMDIRELQQPFNEAISMLRSAKDLIHAIAHGPEGTWINYQPLAIRLRDVAEEIKYGMPHTMCVDCVGGGCGVCKHLGWIPKARLEADK
jgi:hypothetical protein